MIVSRSSFVVLAGVIAATAGSASAAFVAPNGVNYAWTRGVTTNSAYAEWDVFTSAFGGTNTPDVGSSVNNAFDAGAPAWNATNSTPGALVTGGGNIYSPAGPLTGTVTIPSFGLGASATTTVLVQLRTLGTEAVPASILLNGIAPTETTVLFSEATQGFPGANVETLYRFELSGNNAGYSFTFAAQAEHMSLDKVAVDIYAVPAPASAALLGLGGLVAVRRRRAS